MSFYTYIEKMETRNFDLFFSSIEEKDVRRVLNQEVLSEEDFLTLLSPVAQNFLEEMAEKAHKLTVQHFGKTVLLFTPLYIADYCVNHCTYCSFSIINEFERKRLTLDEIEEESRTIASMGLRHILILTGESKQHTPVSYLKDVVSVMKKYFSSIAIEINPLHTEEYQELVEEGVDGLTVYQEVYDRQEYKKYHVKGPKRDYRYRLDAPERGCQAGMRNVTIGSLLGLSDWRTEVFFTGMHAEYLQKKYLGTEINVSLPRIQPYVGSDSSITEVDNVHFVQSMLALRLFLPKAGITLSTRESAFFRDHLLPLGVTKMSAASSTEVGGYTNEHSSVKQFETSDERTVPQITTMLQEKGYQPIYQNWIQV
ncbi:2-iminoacetate synthase ThiH [Bacillus alkalicellulosilyticus]|uniref:2-iminoacetate synthase ThiH n=1 Tax=Alkalihalobacterium alkalicellulosilyticum TaxID=1912214 RepID=UPI000997D7AD|nr:2-iminoacetate synthase ThiH [Bacillus alkalicellulosilyticus]